MTDMGCRRQRALPPSLSLNAIVSFSLVFFFLLCITMIWVGFREKGNDLKIIVSTICLNEIMILSFAIIFNSVWSMLKKYPKFVISAYVDRNFSLCWLCEICSNEIMLLSFPISDFAELVGFAQMKSWFFYFQSFSNQEMWSCWEWNFQHFQYIT